MSLSSNGKTYRSGPEHDDTSHREVHASPHSAIPTIFRDLRPGGVLERTQLYRRLDDIGTEEVLNLLSEHLSRVSRFMHGGVSGGEG